MGRTKCETWVDARTSAASGTAVVVTPKLLGGTLLDEIEELLVYLDVTTPLAGTTPTMRIYLQRAVVPNPDPATDAHWCDIYCFLEITPASSQQEGVTLPIRPWGLVVQEIASWGFGRQTATQAPRECYVGHWGDRIRIVEKMGGTVTTQAVYSIHATGLQRDAKQVE